MKFDMSTFVRGSEECNVRAYLSEVEGRPFFNVCFPIVVTNQQQQKLAMLVGWEKESDPTGGIRKAYLKKLWDDRLPGEKIVPITSKCKI